MKKFILITWLAASLAAHAQEEDRRQDIQTIFRKGRTGGYAALSNKFTSLGGEFANLSEVYGGVFINRQWLLGVGAAGATNYIPVLPEYSSQPGARMSYGYGQAGLVTEYVMGSNRAMHVVFHLFGGVGFTTQYERWPTRDYNWQAPASMYDSNWFLVAEPGVQLEFNLLRWLRFSPGVTYRHAYNSRARGLSDRELSAWSYNATLKIGKF
jgi:hypothetical protein